MEGNEGPPKKGIGQRLAKVPNVAKRIYSNFFSIEEEPIGGDGPVEEAEVADDKIEVEDVAWAIGALSQDWVVFNTGRILKMLDVGKSEKIDYFKQNPEEYRQVNRALQQLVDEKVLTRHSHQDVETGRAITSYSISDKDRLKELGEGDPDDSE